MIQLKKLIFVSLLTISNAAIAGPAPIGLVSAEGTADIFGVASVGLKRNGTNMTQFLLSINPRMSCSKLEFAVKYEDKDGAMQGSMISFEQLLNAEAGRVIKLLPIAILNENGGRVIIDDVRCWNGRSITASASSKTAKQPQAKQEPNLGEALGKLFK